MVNDRMGSLERAASVVGRSAVPRDGRQPLIAWLSALPKLGRQGALAAARYNVGNVLEELDACGLPQGKIKTQQSMARELAIAAYHGETIEGFFVDVSENDLWRARVELLARARQDMTVSPEAAWRTIDQFRQTVGQPTTEYPL
jgi:hypothetical protein